MTEKSFFYLTMCIQITGNAFL